MLWSGLLRLSVISRIWNTKKKGIQGNLKGEGRILGGVFVIGSGDSGIIMEHREHEFGDYANLTQVLAAAMKIGESKK
ncbi:unnamed protein product [Lymnaea stagnalis]|uniref:Peroxiredoxin-like 2A n=1 Tax=Lymnaea stagnalis TaxID=6523 RepID=A0AAV2I210_LYMST